MKRAVHVSITVLCASMMAACTPTPKAGSPVRFSASSDGFATRTSYHGFYEDGGHEYAVIQWENHDPIRIYSPSTNVVQAENMFNGNYCYADYVTTGIVTEGRYSTAKLQSSGNSMQWTSETGKAEFYGVYPNDNPVNVSGSKLRAQVSVPASQTGDNTISSLPLVAYAANVQQGNVVTLDFKAAFTTFEFTIKSDTGNGSLTLNSFTLATTKTSTYLAGTGNYQINNSTLATDYGSDKSQAITVAFATPRVITEQTATTFTIFTLPASLSDLTITVNYTKEGSTVEKKLSLANNKGKTLTFAAGLYHRIYGLAVPDQGIRFYPVTVDPLDGQSHIIDL